MPPSTNARVDPSAKPRPTAGGAELDREAGLTYQQGDWDNECFLNFGEGRDPSPCLACGRTGFYGPRFEEPDRRYRACRFCGFTQNVDGPPQWYRPIVHACDTWPTCAKAPYIWWVAPGIASFSCPFCHEPAKVSEFLVRAPADDPHHPWWKVPQHQRRVYYVRFWENWQPTKGRVYL